MNNVYLLHLKQNILIEINTIYILNLISFIISMIYKKTKNF